MPIDYDERRFSSVSNSVTADGRIKAGRCASRPEILVDGRIRLHERWQWSEGGTESGESTLVEIPADFEGA